MMCGNCTNVTAFHSYYLKAPSARLEDFISPSTLDTLAAEIQDMKALVAKRRPHRSRLWLTETGDAVPGGVDGISDCYVGGFP